jgi:hypothetical protein
MIIKERKSKKAYKSPRERWEKYTRKKPFADRDFPPDSTHIAEDDDGKN